MTIHTIRFFGLYDLNYDTFKADPPAFTSYHNTKNSLSEIPLAKADGIKFAYMDIRDKSAPGGRIPAIVGVETIALDNPVPVDHARHTGVKDFGIRGANIEEESQAHTLLKDIMTANPNKYAALKALEINHFGY